MTTNKPLKKSKNNCRLLIFITFFGWCINAHSQEKIDPYAKTGKVEIKKETVLIHLKASEINVLSGVNATIGPNLNPTVLNHMYLWTNSTDKGSYSFSWKVNAIEKEAYQITAVIEGEAAELTLTCNENEHTNLKTKKGWSRIPLETVVLSKGTNEIKLKIKTNKPLKLSSIELTEPNKKKEQLSEALRVRKNAEWFKDAGYGLMFQWTNRATPKFGDKIKNWEDKVNDFKLDSFINFVERSGASYVIWSMTWGQQYISAPINALDKLISGRTTKRDLLGEIADKLYDKNIKLIFYYHYGYDCYHSKDSVWLEASGGYAEDKTVLYKNISNIIKEVGNRYGNKLHGWFFDGSQRYYDSHFDESSKGILSADFKKISEAARSGNANRILTYNSWRLPRSTEYQDYYAGEDIQKFKDLKEGIFSSGKHKGLMAHTCFTLEKRWGHINWNTEISKPKYSANRLKKYIRYAKKNRYPLSINLEMYENGTVSNRSSKVLEKVRSKILKQ